MDGSIYRVVVAGELGVRFARAFEGMNVTAAHGETVIRGRIVDRAQLRALLDRLDDFGLTLLSVQRECTSDRVLHAANHQGDSRGDT